MKTTQVVSFKRKETFISLPTIEMANLQKYWDVVRQLEPEFYLVRVALSNSKVNPYLIPRICRAIQFMAEGTKFGKVIIYMQNGRITTIEGVESDKLDEPALWGKPDQMNIPALWQEIKK